MEKVQKILSFIFISIWILGGSLAAQKKVQPTKDAKKTGFALGVNLEGPIQKFFDRDKVAFSVIGHLSLGPQIFFVGEAGFENLTFSDEHALDRHYTYESNGSFIRAGLLYDIFSVEEKGNNDNIFFGLHYGFALQEHASQSYNIENEYWGGTDGSLGKYVLNTHWLEISAGPRSELLKNFYMGWSINLRIKMFQDNQEVLVPYSIPGFGNGDNRVNVGFSYVLEYMIPWNKKRSKIDR
jgi:hypothetical protein